MATLTVYSVPGGEGVLYRERIETFAQARAGTTADFIMDLATLASAVQDWTSGSYHPLRRAMLPFDTSALTSAASISAATLSLYGKTVTNPDNTGVYIVQSTEADPTAIALADYDNVGDVATANIQYSSYSTSGYNDFAFDATGLTWISKTSYTKLAARDGLDFNNTGPANGSDDCNFYFSTETGTSKDPKLVITYTLVATATRRTIRGVIRTIP